MTTSTDVFDAVEVIASTASKNAKEALVKQGCADPLFARVCEYAYNPFKNYGLRQLPPGKAHAGFRSFNAATWETLDALIERRLTGHAARDAVVAELDQLDAKSAELFRRIIRKDLRAGFSESTCNKAVKGLIPDFPYMRCSLPKDAHLAGWPGYVSQEKADGMFMNVDHEIGGTVRLTSRQGSPYALDAFEDFVATVIERVTPGTQMHGEMLVVRNGVILPRQEGNGVLNSILAGGSFFPDEYPLYLAWDQIPLSAVQPKGKHLIGYRHRLKALLAQLPGDGKHLRVIPTRICKTLKEAYAHAAELMRHGKEGSVVKHPDAIWKDGTSKEQVKLKLEFAVELRVKAIVPGRDGKRTAGRAGSLACESECGQLKVDVTVKNEAMRDAVDADPGDWIDRIITVVANDITAPSDSNPLHSLFLPRMVEACYRTDKSEADDLQRILDQKDAAIFGKAIKEAA